MTRRRPRSRPDTSPEAVKAILAEKHPLTWAGPAASDFRIIVPLLLATLSEDQIMELIAPSLETYHLSEAVLDESAKAARQWAEQVLATYGALPY
jgi:hypothetical protein